MSSFLNQMKATTALNELIEKAYPGLKVMLDIQRPRTRETITEILNSTLLTPDGDKLKEGLDERDPIVQKYLKKAYEDMYSGRESEASQWLNAVRRKVVDIGMWAQPSWLNFFEFVRLNDDEYPQCQQTYEDEFEIVQLGQDMGVETRRYVKETLSYRDIGMVIRSTPEYAYRLWNPNTGDYQLNKPTMAELERAHRYQVNELCGTIAASILGVFPTVAGGASYLLHNAGSTYSAFQNVPTTNVISMTSEEAITKAVFLAIFDYMDRMPAYGEGGDGQLAINTIHIPSIEMTELYQWVSVTSGWDHSGTTPNIYPKATFSPSFQAELERGGIPSGMFGRSFNIVSDKTLAAKSLYVSFNTPAGTVWDKPSRDMLIDRLEQEKNRGITQLMKVYQVASEPHQRPSILKITYKT